MLCSCSSQPAGHKFITQEAEAAATKLTWPDRSPCCVHRARLLLHRTPAIGGDVKLRAVVQGPAATASQQKQEHQLALSAAGAKGMADLVFAPDGWDGCEKAACMLMREKATMRDPSPDSNLMDYK